MPHTFNIHSSKAHALKALLTVIVALTGLVWPDFARAQGGTAQQMVLVVPYAAGGPTDVVGRLIAREMSRILGQPIVVENVAGAGGTVGAARVAKAQPDGQTILLSNIGHATAPALYARLPFRAEEDFEPIGLVVDVPMTLIGRPNLPAETVADLKVWAADNRGRVTIAHAGTGASSQLCALLVMRAIGTEFVQVPYSGTAQALNDVLGRHVDLLCDQTSNTGGQIREGKVRVFGVTSPARIDTLPAVPTLREAGLPDAEVSVWHGLYAPRGTPAATLERLSEALKSALATEAVSGRFVELGGVPAKPEAATPAALKAHLAAEIQRWRQIIQAAGVKPQE